METNLELRLRSGAKTVWLASREEDRSALRIQAVAEGLGYVAFVWDGLQGFVQLTEGTFRQPGDGNCGNVEQALNAMGSYAHEKALFIVRDLSLLIDRIRNSPDYVVLTRRMKGLYHQLRRSNNAVVFLSPTAVMPPELEDCLASVEAPLPDESQRLEIITSWIAANCSGIPCEVDEDTPHHLVSVSAGMSCCEIQAALALSVVKRKGLTCQAVKDMLAEKVAVVKRTELLEYIPASQTLDDVGGLEGLKDFLGKRSQAYGPAAARYGLPIPKGILVAGPPGTGKSLMAKAAAGMLNMPLLGFDAGRIHGSLVGQSEERMRQALGMVESQAPCVMRIDEIEKAFAGVRGPAGDSGVTQRTFGYFLTWMNDHTSPVFILATANDISQLPPEFLRKGRFDEIFFVDLPSADERKAIMKVLLGKYGQQRRGLVTEALIRKLDRYTGAEMEYVIREAMYEAFHDDQRAIRAGDLSAAATRILPVADQMRERIEELRRWGKVNARPAS